ncbi:LLM class flavin-dependent oxidoreductase [Flaviflexus huanghaiensis]|uniref:LLM class flavin-dependent oxidoreductase n=1 Tax=Flaviflexus huanghaiensis TaxID=1111473 RepID=UPI0015FE4132|nr:LLM class flavin-dependent oxidoreductase [Flaviflexus huanghaiensis]
MKDVEFGLNTFGDMTVDADGHPKSSAQVIRDVVEEAVLADSLGIDAIGLGEHHRDDYAISAPDMILAAIASRTNHIKLGTAVTVLSSEDPLRVFERFATLDAVSRGRAEVVVGRGSFTESFPLFGYKLSDYTTLFEEKFEIFTETLKERPIRWSGQHRAPIEGAMLMPRTENGLSAWVGVGGSPESVIRSVRRGIPMMLAVIGGAPARFRPFVDLYERAQKEFGVDTPMPLGMHSPGHVADTDEQARAELWEPFRANRIRIGRERGWDDPTYESFVEEIEHGALFVGSPETVAQKISENVRILGLDRFDFKYSNGPMPHEQLMTSLELYGTKVLPRVKDILSRVR